MHWWIFLIPFISGLPGWWMNSQLIKLLFHPLPPTKIAGFIIQGIFPKQQLAPSNQFGKFAANDFFCFKSIEQKITDTWNLASIMSIIEQRVDEFLRVKPGKEMPVVNLFIGEKTFVTMKAVFKKSWQHYFHYS